MRSLAGGSRRALIPYAILAASLIITNFSGRYVTDTLNERSGLEFERSADRVGAAIVSRIDAYTAMLYGTAGLFAANDNVSFAEFRSYVEQLRLPRRYPGVQGIGFSRVIRPDEREPVAAQVRQHFPSFAYYPEAQDGTIHAIVYLEPLDKRNAAALGYDMFSEQTRREAMTRARDGAMAAASGPVRLVQEIDKSSEQMGFLIYVPLYRGGAIPGTVDARRQQLLGFVYSPFRSGDLLRAILGPIEAREVLTRVHDSTVSDQTLLDAAPGSDAGAPLETERRLEIAGRSWVVRMRPGPAFDEPLGGRAGWGVVAVGSALSLMLFGVTRGQVRARFNAERTAEELRRSEEALRAANQSKDEFLAIVSHELRTPLNAIIGWVAMLRRGQIPHGDLPRALEVIDRNAVAQARLVEDLIDISRAVAGRLRLELEAVEVPAILQAAVDAVRPAAAHKGVELTLAVTPDLGAIHADSARLQQIMVNLLANGIKFTQRGGCVQLDARRDDQRIVIRVSDTGIGIKPEFLPQVFDRFRQADSSTTRTHSGVGLGLSIAKHLVELHGGSIEVSSEGEGRGTVVRVTI